MPKVVGQDPSIARRVTCKNCGSIIEYFLYEVKRHRHSYDYLGDFEISNVITCPKCNKLVVV